MKEQKTRRGRRPVGALLGVVARWRPLVFLGCLLASSAAWASAGGKTEGKLVQVLDTRDMAPGVTRWVADVYNSNLWLYGLLVVGVMATIGLVLGLTFDRLIGLLGINLGKLDHHE